MILSVFNPGTITVNCNNRIDRKGFDHSGAYATYEANTLESIVQIVNRHQVVIRPSGKMEDAKKYTLRKAKFDLN
jgi:hypothetical protein